MSDFDVQDDRPVRSRNFRRAIVALMIDECAARLDRPGPDGAWSCSAILEWLWFEGPPVDRFTGTQNSAQCGGLATAIENHQDPSGGFVEPPVKGVRIGPVDAFDLRDRLRHAIDRTVSDWLDDRGLSLASSQAEEPFAEGAASNAEAEHETRASKRYVPDIGEFGP